MRAQIHQFAQGAGIHQASRLLKRAVIAMVEPHAHAHVVTIGKLREVASETGEPLTKLAVAWILANPAITSVILGASRTEQLTDTLAAADYSLMSELKAKLDELTVEYRRGDAVR